MKIIPRRLQGVFEIRLSPLYDHRGHFMRIYDENIFSESGLHRRWLQENQSVTLRKDTIRGLHFQYAPSTETKLVRAAKGAVYDVFVDLRTDSPTFGEWDSIELSEDTQAMIYLPRGFAHGFCTRTDYCVVQYKVDQEFSPIADGGIRWNDPSIGVQWPTEAPILSEKDKNLPTLEAFLAQHKGLDVK
ncbi:dTDP-4-dehydrorhamnose 3,5-epimerase [Paenibacillus sp. HN-1]|uniref:dTDP-4-dehydrorhamnose 3,5-epimerase n=1 Tax=Paenibacillus TaxID=44249 RepID=UPI001CA7E464|nr:MULTISPECIES: dTDP-4-dehydrorhamnose 3,5-epimerase [Paenibacillus]MBY9078657.1 dTDP-4-dehydrorhamnose 3,5-epimerase [Paenibacillus sp. CGMCC 1.18879]MBY9084193.1 dTDP-4-dehydrorhamnose 3,5-epimerase [Paenibacillus sinensis]